MDLKKAYEESGLKCSYEEFLEGELKVKELKLIQEETWSTGLSSLIFAIHESKLLEGSEFENHVQSVYDLIIK